MPLSEYITIKTWNEKYYEQFVKYLVSLEDINYKIFHSSLVLNSKYEIIGIRMPIIREIAKNISKSNFEEFLQYAQDKYYEEVMIQDFFMVTINKTHKKEASRLSFSYILKY